MSSKVHSILLSLGLMVAGAGSAAAQSAPTGSWANETAGIQFVYGGFASDNTYMYLFGGYQYGVSNSYPQYYAATRRYDPANNSWATLAFMPNPQYYNAGAFYDGYCYSFGGYNPNYGYWNGIQRYNISSNSWSVLSATLSSPRYIMPAVVLNDRIYITGGYYNGYSYVNDEFNPTAGTVTPRASLLNNQGLYYHAASAVPSLGKFYIFGGLLNGTQSSLCHEYTPPSAGSPNGAWVAKANMSNGQAQQTRYGHVAVTLNSRPYITGGYFNGYSTNTLEYNPFTDSWAQRANMSNGRYLHAGVAIGGKMYVYGGYSTYTTNEEYTPPDFGVPPNPPANLMQIGSRPETANQSQPDQTQFDGWTNNQIQFSADVTDPDVVSNSPQQVRFRVQVKPQAAAWTQANQVTTLETALGAQGTKVLTYTIPADGGYDWRWRLEDSYGNSHPVEPGAWVEAFGSVAAPNTNSPDFRSDQLPPSDPVANQPHNYDIQVPDPVIGDVVLHWTESTDNGPVAGISYEIQVATDGGFLDIEAQLFSTAGTSQYPVALTVSRYDKHWRIRAQDVGGNLSNWSEPRHFRVTYNDGLNHSAGDAKKACGFGVAASPTLLAGVMGLALLAGSLSRRRRA
jgi:hypothetical protein